MRRQVPERQIDGTKFVRHKGKLCPLYPLADPVPPPPDYPTADPLWTRFVEFVNSGGVVRADLLTMRDADWRIMWLTYKAGSLTGVTG